MNSSIIKQENGNVSHIELVSGFDKTETRERLEWAETWGLSSGT